MSSLAQKKDTLFASSQPMTIFRFNEQVASVFDDMIQRSVPGYREVQTQIYKLIEHMNPNVKTVYDLGTSTGQMLFSLDQMFLREDIHYVGVDLSDSMIEKAKKNQSQLKLKGQFKFLCEDVVDIDFVDADVVIINYVLQFVEPENRLSFLKKIYDDMPEGSLLFVSEKTKQENGRIDNSFVKLYDEFKLNNHYSMLEIAQKRKALENVLRPFTFRENMDLLEKAGFSEVSCFFSWFNFSSFVAIK